MSVFKCGVCLEHTAQGGEESGEAGGVERRRRGVELLLFYLNDLHLEEAVDLPDPYNIIIGNSKEKAYCCLLLRFLLAMEKLLLKSFVLKLKSCQLLLG